MSGIESRHDHILSDSECAAEHTTTECREVVLVAMSNLFDEAMGAQAFQPVGGTAGGEIPEMGSEIGGAKAADVPLPAGEGDKKAMIFTEEEIEAPIGAVFLSYRFGHFVDGVQSCIGVIDAGHEAEIAFIGSMHQLSQIGEAIDVFSQGCEFELLAPIALFHPTVVFEEGDIVGGAFHPSHETEFIVELEACWSHMMADACTLNAGVKIVTGLPAEGRGKFASQEGGDVFCLEGMHGGTHDGLIEGLEIGLAVEDDIGRESQGQGVALLGAPRMQLHLHAAPVITSAKLTQDRTEAFRPSVQTPMQAFGIEAIGKRLSLLGIADGQEGIIGALKGDPCLGQSLG